MSGGDKHLSRATLTVQTVLVGLPEVPERDLHTADDAVFGASASHIMESPFEKHEVALLIRLLRQLTQNQWI